MSWRQAWGCYLSCPAHTPTESSHRKHNIEAMVLVQVLTWHKTRTQPICISTSMKLVHSLSNVEVAVSRWLQSEQTTITQWYLKCLLYVPRGSSPQQSGIRGLHSQWNQHPKQQGQIKMQVGKKNKQHLSLPLLATTFVEKFAKPSIWQPVSYNIWQNLPLDST